MLIKAFTAYVFLRGFLFPCHFDKKVNDFTNGRKAHKIEKIIDLPSSINESSGLAPAGKDHYFSHNDSGGLPCIYKFNLKGELTDSLYFPNLKNKDWEELAHDFRGNTYICDFGNNANKRKDLRIHKVSPQGNYLGDINFHYPDQTAFPPPEEQRNFDCEAAFCFNDTLYLFSKNRGDRWVKMYTLPNAPGTYEATLKDSIQLKGMITGASFFGDGFTLLGYGYIYTFKTPGFDINFSSPDQCTYYGRLAQSEAIHQGKDFSIITNEQGRVYRYIKKHDNRPSPPR